MQKKEKKIIFYQYISIVAIVVHSQNIYLSLLKQKRHIERTNICNYNYYNKGTRK